VKSERADLFRSGTLGLLWTRSPANVYDGSGDGGRPDALREVHRFQVNRALRIEHMKPSLYLEGRKSGGSARKGAESEDKRVRLS
jgi:hypothetical protein